MTTEPYKAKDSLSSIKVTVVPSLVKNDFNSQNPNPDAENLTQTAAESYASGKAIVCRVTLLFPAVNVTL